MKCEKCGKNEATMYYKETVNGVTREMHLCPECAQKENLGGAFENAFQSMNHFWSDPFHSFLGGGCPDCYSTFADILNPYVQKIHGATRHIGTAPAAPEQPKADPVADLKAQLKAAVESEDYERAASLRDEIRRMEGEQK